MMRASQRLETGRSNPGVNVGGGFVLARTTEQLVAVFPDRKEMRSHSDGCRLTGEAVPIGENR
jgi:hypothetical protein